MPVQRADRSRSHVNQDDNGEAPCGTPQPSLVKERSGLHQVKDDKQGQGNDEDLSHVKEIVISSSASSDAQEDAD